MRSQNKEKAKFLGSEFKLTEVERGMTLFFETNNVSLVILVFIASNRPEVFRFVSPRALPIRLLRFYLGKQQLA